MSLELQISHLYLTQKEERSPITLFSLLGAMLSFPESLLQTSFHISLVGTGPHGLPPAINVAGKVIDFLFSIAGVSKLFQ